jgi:hypothetical protein
VSAASAAHSLLMMLLPLTLCVALLLSASTLFSLLPVDVACSDFFSFYFFLTFSFDLSPPWLDLNDNNVFL